MGFDRIADEIERNKLVVGYLDDIDHWLVIYGYRRDVDGVAEIFVADPGEGACVQPWSEYGPRLGSFGIVVSRPGPASGVRQAPLALADDPAPILPRRAGRLQCRPHSSACRSRSSRGMSGSRVARAAARVSGCACGARGSAALVESSSICT
jgi:hypothetical protein